eukprot:gnl/MRDRNA2_/MRDRNA2_29977_c0_seq1.p1 gnl/MRDRNA2_/MRDRNA2_29977_c0~~gnl/MRDRNA2_/MRDRNA2_29977_c0_seq1.p1  ORF type:complete len:443 (+),score=89.38 gnl/MRDRNA2_/MRDRNA2_29977_c0_seq1:91-1419(+)
MMCISILCLLASLCNVAFCSTSEDSMSSLRKPKVAMHLREKISPDLAEKEGQRAARMFASLRQGRRLKEVTGVPSSNGPRRLKEVAKGAPKDGKKDGALAGKLALFSVPLLWGTATPVLRFMYNLPNSPNPAELSAIRCIIAVIALIGPTLKKMQSKKAAGGVTTWKDITAGLEIGMWAGLGQGFQAFGVKHTTASKAGFILTSINVMVPALAFVRGKKVPAVTWIACVVAMIGVVVMSNLIGTLTGSGGASSGGEPGFTYGDASVLLGAVMYSWVTVRTSELAPGRDHTMLTCLKKVMMAAGSITWDIVQAMVRHVGMFSSGLWTLQGTTLTLFLEAWAALMWSALVPGTLAAVLQIFAQSHVSAAESQLVYATSPVFNTFFSSVFLHEQLTAPVLGGGAILIFASLMPHLWKPLAAMWKKAKQDGVFNSVEQPNERSSLR